MPNITLGFVYGLTDPRLSNSATVRYIGVTTNPNVRYRTHLACPQADPVQKNAWVQDVLATGFEPGIEIFEVFKMQGDRKQLKEQAREHETYWIRCYLALGANLVNNQVGDTISDDDFIDLLLMRTDDAGIILSGEPD